MNVAPLLSIIIPARDQWPLTRQCLHALRAATPGDFFEVLVVDNASQDATPTASPLLGRELFGERFLALRQEANLGFGPACNLAAHTARGELLFFLNNDTVPRPGWFEPLRRALATQPGLGAVGPLLLYPDSDKNQHRVQHLGVAFCPQKNVSHLYELFPATHPLVRTDRSVQALSAAALLLRRSQFLALGGFYPGYVNGFEDLELCARIREQGLGLRCVPESEIIHHTSQTPGRFDHDQANARLFRERCETLIIPDLHHHLLHDGLELRLTPWLLPHAAMPDADAERLSPFTGAPLDSLPGLLEPHPLWSAGYEAAARIIEDRRDWAQALKLRLRQATLCPSLAAYTHLLRAGLKCGQKELAAETQCKITVINRILADPHTLRRKAAHLANQARTAGDDYLERLYRQACTPDH